MARREVPVVIVGAGPAGLLLATLLTADGIDCVVLERESRQHIEGRARAGIVEHRTVELLRQHGLADRLLREGRRQDECELRVEGAHVVVHFPRFCDGAAQHSYPQHELVRDLVERLLALGGEIVFGARNIQLDRVDTDRPRVAVDTHDGHRTIGCRLLVGCDGPHGVVRSSLPASAFHVHERRRDYGWLAVLATVPPISDHNVYALHEEGFAACVPRTAQCSRLYLQCPAGDTASDWPDERIWATLKRRLDTDNLWLWPDDAQFTQRGLLDMASWVSTPMRHGNVLLAGDAAHLLPPAGGKGMNLALGDAAELAAGVSSLLHHRDPARLAGYSAARLRQVWQAQEFSDWFLSLLHVDPQHSSYQHELQRARLDLLRCSTSYARSFARRLVGVNDAPG